MIIETENRVIHVYKDIPLCINSKEHEAIHLHYQNYGTDYFMNAYCYISVKSIKKNGGIKKMITEKVKDIFGDSEIKYVRSIF